jgi:aminopeptidase N
VSKAQEAPWVVPLTITSQPGWTTLFEAAEGEFALAADEKKLAHKLNTDQCGFYRVQYSEELLEELFDSSQSLSAGDKLGLQNDLFALSQSGHIPISQWLSRLKSFFEPDMNYFVLSSICANLRSVCKLHSEQEYYPKLQAFIISCFTPIFEEIGWTNAPKSTDPHIFAMTRAEVISMLGLADFPPVVSECRRLFLDEQPIVPDLRGVVYATAVRLGEAKEYERAVSLYESTDAAAEKMRCLSVLGLSTAAVQRTLKWALEQVRVGDAPYLFGSLASTPVGRKATWEFLKTHWTAVAARFHSHTLLADIVGSVISGFSDRDMISDIMAFFAANPCPSADRTINQGLELITSQAARRIRDVKALASFFA